LAELFGNCLANAGSGAHYHNRFGHDAFLSVQPAASVQDAASNVESGLGEHLGKFDQVAERVAEEEPPAP
jgi:hypothetical protein